MVDHSQKHSRKRHDYHVNVTKGQHVETDEGIDHQNVKPINIKEKN